MSSDDTRRLALELFEALNAADVSKLDALYADDFELWTAGNTAISGTSNKQEALGGMKMIDDAFPKGLVFSIQAMTVEGDRAAIEATSDGIHVSGLTYRNQYHFLMRTRDGKIIGLREYLDTMHANEVLVESLAGD